MLWSAWIINEIDDVSIHTRLLAIDDVSIGIPLRAIPSAQGSSPPEVVFLLDIYGS